MPSQHVMQLKFLEDGACKALIETLDTQISVANVIIADLKAISNLVAIENNMMLFREFGACESVVAAIQTNISVGAIAEEGCRTVRDLLVGNINRFMNAGICETVIDCLKIHRNTESIIDEVCRLIMEITANNEENKRRMILDGADDVLRELILDTSLSSGIRFKKVNSCKLKVILISIFIKFSSFSSKSTPLSDKICNDC